MERSEPGAGATGSDAAPADEPSYPFRLAGLGPLPLPLTYKAACATAAIDATVSAVSEIDHCLLHLASILDRAQPSRPGKISVRFRRARQRTAEGQRPVFVQWSRKFDDTGWAAKVLEPSAVLVERKTEGAFAPGAEFVKTALKEARSLMNRREALLRLLDEKRRVLVLTAGSVRAAVAQSAQLVEALRPQVEEARQKALEAHYERKRQRETEASLQPRARG